MGQLEKSHETQKQLNCIPILAPKYNTAHGGI